MDKEAIPTVLKILSAQDFHGAGHQAIFHCMVDLEERGKEIDEISLCDALREINRLQISGGELYIESIADNWVSASNVSHHAEIVKKCANERQMLSIATSLASAVSAQAGDVATLVDETQSQLSQIVTKRQGDEPEPLKNILMRVFKHLEKVHANPESMIGVPTGYLDLDDMLNGMQRGDLFILAARPSVGKTAFGLNIALNASLRAKVPTLFFSLEMTSDLLAMRMISSHARIDGNRLRTMRIKDNEWPKIAASLGSLSEAQMWIHAPAAGANVAKLRQTAKKMKAQGNLGLVVVDYLGRIKTSGNAQNREREVSAISNSLKDMAMELDVPVLCLCQLNRNIDSRADKRPVLSDLRESGAIEQDADVVAFIHRDDDKNPDGENKGTAEIIIGKHRNGPTGSVRLAYFSEHTRFENLTPGDRR